MFIVLMNSQREELFPRIPLRAGFPFIFKPLVPGALTRTVYEGLQGRHQLKMIDTNVISEPSLRGYKTMALGLEAITLGALTYAATKIFKEPTHATLIALYAGAIRTFIYGEFW